jgi:hypothetical protein
MLVSGVIAGLIAGYLRTRDLATLANLRVTWFPLLVASLVLRAVGPTVIDILPIYLAAIVGTTLVAARNWRLAGAPAILAGSVLNLVVIVLNGGMPVDFAGLREAGALLPRDALHVPMTDRTVLTQLSDVIVISPLRAAYSLGDVLLAAGGFFVPFIGMRRA